MLKKRISELKAIEENPKEETEKLIAEKDREIRKLQREMGLIDQKKKEEVSLLEKRLEEERQRHQNLKQELEKFKQTGDEQELSQTTSQTKKKDWQTELLDRAIELRDKEKFEEAIRLLSQIIKKKPDHQSAYFQRAYCLDELKDFEGAITDLNKAIELDPKDVDSYTNRGNAFFELKDLSRAIEDYNIAIELDSKNASTYYNRGNAFYKLKDLKRAIVDCNKAIELGPIDASYYNTRGLSFAKQKDYKRAIVDYNKAIKLDPKNVIFQQNLSESLLIIEKIGEVEVSAQIAINLSQSIDKQAISNCLQAICLRLQEKDTKKVDDRLKQLCDEDFEISWYFDEIENWLTEATISKETKNYIRGKTEMLKKHTTD